MVKILLAINNMLFLVNPILLMLAQKYSPEIFTTKNIQIIFFASILFSVISWFKVDNVDKGKGPQDFANLFGSVFIYGFPLILMIFWIFFKDIPSKDFGDFLKTMLPMFPLLILIGSAITQMGRLVRHLTKGRLILYCLVCFLYIGLADNIFASTYSLYLNYLFFGIIFCISNLEIPSSKRVSN